jgi:hypothetical protein
MHCRWRRGLLLLPQLWMWKSGERWRGSWRRGSLVSTRLDNVDLDLVFALLASVALLRGELLPP